MTKPQSYFAPLFAGIFWLLASSLAQADDWQQAGRAAFLPRYSALNAGQSEPPMSEQDRAALSAYPLTPWINALRLRNALMGNEPGAAQQVIGFLTESGEAAYTRDLRRSLLKTLADRGDWATLVTQYRAESANEESRCLNAQARIALGDTAGLAEDLAQRWLAEGEKRTSACDSPMAWLRSQKAFSAELVVQRLRSRLLDGDVAQSRQLLSLLADDGARAPYSNWLALLENRSAGFTALSQAPGAPIDAEGLADVFLRHARGQTEDAATLLPGIIANQGLPQPVADHLTGNLAMVLAWSRDPRALELFRPVRLQAVKDERVHEWMARSAIWGGDWALAVRCISEMPSELGHQQRWRYWLGRSLIASGQQAAGQALLQTLSREFDTFGLLAAWRLGQPYTPASRPALITPAISSELARNASLVRAREAYQLNLSSIASLEWRTAINTLSEAARPALIPEASRWGWYAMAITTGTELRIFDDADPLFPRPYESLVREASEQADVPMEWIWGVMRRESAFRPDAGSGAGALGLLQMLPSTAAITARKYGQSKPSRSDLLNPAINVPLGALHMRDVLDRFGGNWLFALGAYNAGPNALKKWFPPRAMDADVWMENIPFNETRNYIQRILMHAAVYQWQTTGKPVRADAWLPVIQPQ